MRNSINPHMRKSTGRKTDEANAAHQTGNPAANNEYELSPHQEAQVGMALSPSREP